MPDSSVEIVSPRKRRRSRSADSIANSKIYHGWTFEGENNIEKLGNEAAIFKWLHRRSAVILSNRLETTTLIAAVLSAIGGSSEFVSFMTQLQNEDAEGVSLAMSLTASIISLCATVLLIVQRTCRYTEKIRNNKDAEQKYQWTNFKIQSQLQLPMINRQQGEAFFEWISHTINNISQIEDIEDKALRDYQKRFPGNLIPGIDGIQRVEVNRSVYQHIDATESTTSGAHTPLDQSPATSSKPSVDNIAVVTIPQSPPTPSALSRALGTTFGFGDSDVTNVRDAFRQRRGEIMDAGAGDKRASLAKQRAMEQSAMEKKLQYEMSRAQSANLRGNSSGDTPYELVPLREFGGRRRSSQADGLKRRGGVSLPNEARRPSHDNSLSPPKRRNSVSKSMLSSDIDKKLHFRYTGGTLNKSIKARSAEEAEASALKKSDRSADKSDNILV